MYSEITAFLCCLSAMDWLCYLFKKLFCVLACGGWAEGVFLWRRLG